jgi:hypothetical protein
VLAVKENILSRSIFRIEKQYYIQKSVKNVFYFKRLLKLFNQNSRYLFRLINQDSFISSENLIAETNLTIYPHTIKYYLKKLGTKHCKVLRQLKLTKIYTAKQLAFI